VRGIPPPEKTGSKKRMGIQDGKSERLITMICPPGAGNGLDPKLLVFSEPGTLQSILTGPVFYTQKPENRNQILASGASGET
jgi:hypothetical protein